MKKLVNSVFLLCMVISFCFVIPSTASAATVDSGTCGDNLTWVLDDSGTLVISGSGDMYNSEAVEGKNGYVSKAPWISEIDNITTLKIENGVTSIGDNSFIKMTNLTNVYLPETLTNIGVRAFLGCNKIKEILLPQSVVNIEPYAFSDCRNLTDISLPNSITNIGEEAFSECKNLRKIEIPDSVTSISGYPTYYRNGIGILGACTNLEEVKIGRGCSHCGVIFGGIYGFGIDSTKDYYPNLKKVIYPQKSSNSASWGGKQFLYGWKTNDFVFYCTGNPNDDLSYVDYRNTANEEKTDIVYIHEINYDANGGEYAPSYQAKFPGENLKITSKIPTKEGYIFKGWSKNSEAKTVDYLSGSTYSNDETITLYAVWEENDISVTDITLNKSTLSMIEGNSETLTATITPTNATNNGITWTSSNTSVATVSNGKVTAKASGTATITVTTVDGGYTASCVVTVTAVDTPVSVTGVTLNKSAVSLEEGKTETLVATVAPSNATDSSVSWTSSNTSVATVVNGKVTAISAGTAVITATTTDGGYTAQCTVTVTEKVVDENAPKIIITDIKTMPGKEIRVTVDLANNTGFASLGIEVGYNSEVMTLTNVTSNSGVGGTFTPGPNYTINPFNMGWDSASNITYNGNLATLTFTVGEDVADGVYPITIDYYKGVNGNYVDGDNINYDEDFEAVGFVYISGNVIVASYIPGDINGDESVDNKDATYLLRYLAGWSISGLVEDALDVDGSSSVDNKDATILLRYLAGWNVTLH